MFERILLYKYKDKRKTIKKLYKQKKVLKKIRMIIISCGFTKNMINNLLNKKHIK